MNQEQAGLIMVAVLVIALGLAWWGWRNRKTQYAYLLPELTFGEPTGKPLVEVSGLYVATTRAGAPIDRVALGPLAYRSTVRLSVHPQGVSVAMPGSETLLLPATQELSAGLATWTIDRVVEPEGLLMIRWRLGDLDVDSYFRIVDQDPNSVIAAIAELPRRVK